jgi:hypothetical protein
MEKAAIIEPGDTPKPCLPVLLLSPVGTHWQNMREASQFTTGFSIQLRLASLIYMVDDAIGNYSLWQNIFAHQRGIY